METPPVILGKNSPICKDSHGQLDRRCCKTILSEKFLENPTLRAKSYLCSWMRHIPLKTGVRLGGRTSSSCARYVTFWGRVLHGGCSQLS
ncbi:hypothetical protein C356_04681 [Cryptococcus neoformans c45]|nr:hypothetical protein C356_04681 [Cryptococcus neoformans var. grubii c45]